MAVAYVPAALRYAPFTAREAAAAGVSRSALRSAPWRKVLRNVWVHESVPDSKALRLAALRLVVSRDAFVCGPTAAWFYGADAQGSLAQLIWLGQPGRTKPRRRPGCRMVNLSLADGEVISVDGLAITSATRTAFDCGRWLPLIEAVVVVDVLAREGRVDIDELKALAADAIGVRGIRNLRHAITLTDPRSESPMESRVRVLLMTSGLPRPTSQSEVYDAAGRFLGRADLANPDRKVIVEYDGAWHWDRRRADDRRRDDMRAAGWTVIVVSREDYYSMPDALVARVRAALRYAESGRVRG